MLCALLLLAASLALATNARVASLGGEMPFYLDDTQIFRDPSLMAKFPNKATLELGDLDLSNQSAYGVLNFMQSFYLGAGFLRTKDDFEYIELPGDLSQPANDLDILLGASFGQLSLGLGTHFAGFSLETEEGSNQTTEKTNVMAFDFGGSYTADEMLIDGGLEIRLNSYLDETIADDVRYADESDGGMGMSFFGRGFIPMSSFKFVPAFNFDMFSYTPQEVTGDSTTEGAKYSRMQLGFMLGGNIPVFETGWIAPGIGFHYITSKTDGDSWSSTTSYMIFPEVYLGGELPITKWFDARIGYHRYFGGVSEEYKTGDTTNTTSSGLVENDQPDQITVGAGLKLAGGKILIDGCIGEDIIHEGGYIISGMQHNLFATVSMGIQF